MSQGILQEELWLEIGEFPGYAISCWGNVINKDTGHNLKVTLNSHGCPMVGLMKKGTQNKRSLPVLVARAFLSSPEHESFDTPIHLDGNRSNCRADNLMWRPLWFSRKYMRQFTDEHDTYSWPIEDMETGDRYDSSMHAAVVNGLLDADICFGMMTNVYVWPTHQTFSKVIER